MEINSYSNFPLLFGRVGRFLNQFGKLKELGPNSPKFSEEFENLVREKHSRSDYDEALAAFDEIVGTIYCDRRVRCLGGITEMGK
jgi:hypothetical protein